MERTYVRTVIIVECTYVRTVIIVECTHVRTVIIVERTYVSTVSWHDHPMTPWLGHFYKRHRTVHLCIIVCKQENVLTCLKSSIWQQTLRAGVRMRANDTVCIKIHRGGGVTLQICNLVHVC